MYSLKIKSKPLFSCLLASLLFCTTNIVTAQENRYITDIVYVTIRSGAGNEYRIISSRIKSGATVSVLEGNDDDEWVKVRTENGLEGWIRSQYLTKEMTGRMQLKRVAARNSELEKQNKLLQTQNQQLTKDNQALDKQTSTATKNNSAMAAELQKIKSLSADAINLDRRYRELLESHKILQTQHEALTVENDKLKGDQRLNYMFYGAGIMLLGMVITLLLPALKPKKRYSEWR